MNTWFKRISTFTISSLFLLSTIFIVPETPFVIEAEAHQGRTDSSGGHKDNKNKSGLGSYHYHCGGNPPHLHTNGVCPYQSTVVNNTIPKPVETETAIVEITSYGWQKDATGWWYLAADRSYANSCWVEIDGSWYYFGADGYLMTNCHTPDGHWVDHNGVWIE